MAARTPQDRGRQPVQPAPDVDAISVAEAHAGATDANAGFLLVNVLDNKVAGFSPHFCRVAGCFPTRACSSIAHPVTSLFVSTASPTAHRLRRRPRTHFRRERSGPGVDDACCASRRARHYLR